MVQRSSGRGCWYRLVLSPDVCCVVKPALRALRASRRLPKFHFLLLITRIAHPASGLRWRPQPTARRPHPRNRHRAPAVSRQTDVQFELVVVVSQHAPHRTPHRPPTSTSTSSRQRERALGTLHAPLPYPSTRLHPSSSLGRASVFKSTLPRTHLPSFINPTLRTHHHSSPHLFTATQHSARHRPPVTRLSICALHSRTHLLCTAPAPSHLPARD